MPDSSKNSSDDADAAVPGDPKAGPAPAPERDAVASSNPGISGWVVGAVLVGMLLIGFGVYHFVSRALPNPSANYTGVPVAQDGVVPDGWSEYRDTQGRVAFAVPPQWRFATELVPGADAPQVSDNGNELVRTWAEGDLPNPPFTLIGATVGTVDGGGTPEAAVEGLVDNFTVGIAGTTAGPTQSFTTVNGLSGAWIDLTSSTNGLAMDGVAIALVNGNNFAFFVEWAYGDSADRDTLHQLVDTVRIDRG